MNHLLLAAAFVSSMSCNGPSWRPGANDEIRPLFENGRSVWVVAVPADAPAPLRYAASELTNTVFRISGARLAVDTPRRAPAKNVIRLEADSRESLEDVFSVRTSPGEIVLRGNSPRGALFAAYAFLSDWLGARWFWPGEDGEFLPKLKRYVPAAREKVYRPPFGMREMSLCGIDKHRHPDTERWCVRMFMNTGINTPEIREEVGAIRRTSGHVVSLPVEMKDRKPIFEAHPEWFSLIGGKRDIEGIAGCWSNDGFFAYTVSNLVHDIRSKNAVLANYFVADVVPRCECKGCTVNPDRSARWWNYYARLVDAIRREIPGMHFAGLAYQEYRDIPKVPVKNMDHVEYCHYNRCFHHLLGDKTCPWNVRSMNEFRRWGEMAPLAFYGYEFDVVSEPGRLYLPMWHLFADEMRIFRDMKLRRVKTEMSVDRHIPWLTKSQKSQYASRLPYYLWAKLAFDPDSDVDELLADFCKRVYGPGAAEMRSYHDLMADAWCSIKYHVSNYGTFAKVVAGNLITQELEEEAKARLSAAAAAAGGDACAAAQIALDTECFDRWVKLSREGRAVNVVHDLELSGKPSFAKAEWLEAKAAKGKTQPTRFKIVRGKRALRVLAECREKDMSALDRGTDRDDAHDWKSPTLEFFIDVGDGACRQIAITPAGGVWDAKDGDMKWNSGAKTRSAFDAGKWSMEIILPYVNFGGEPEAGGSWKLMAIRNEGAAGFSSCGWPIAAHRDFGSAAKLVFK